MGKHFWSELLNYSDIYCSKYMINGIGFHSGEFLNSQYIDYNFHGVYYLAPLYKNNSRTLPLEWTMSWTNVFGSSPLIGV